MMYVLVAPVWAKNACRAAAPHPLTRALGDLLASYVRNAPYMEEECQKASNNIGEPTTIIGS